MRNPYSRTLSAYLSKVYSNLKKNKKVHINKRNLSGIDLNKCDTFTQFCHFLDSGNLYANGHWAPQSEFLIFPVAEYDFIGHFESLSGDFDKVAANILKKETGWGVIKEDPGHATNADARMDAFYTRETYDIIYRLYQVDFDMFGYEKR